MTFRFRGDSMITFTVDGAAVPKQRPRLNGRSGMAYTPKKTREYESKVRDAFLTSWHKAVPAYEKGVPVKACIEVIQPIPKSWSNSRTLKAQNDEIQPTVKNGDLDNYAKSILDALNGFVYADDCQVTTLIIHKKYGATPYVWIQFDEDV